MCQPEWRRARTAALAESGQDSTTALAETGQDTTTALAETGQNTAAGQVTTGRDALAPSPAPARTTAPDRSGRTGQESRSPAHPPPLA